MSLVKNPELTPEKLAANQANGQRSLGPITPEGLQRAREARLVHGFYSDNACEALRVLGEDPKEFGNLVISLLDTWQAHDHLERRLVHSLARAIWRLQRGDRVRESLAVTELNRMDARADRRVRRQSAAYERKLAGLNAVREACSRAEFVTTQVEIDALASAYRGKPTGRASEILVLLLRLAPVQAPGPELPAGESLAVTQRTEPPVAEGPRRDELRDRLHVLLREEVEALEERRAREGEDLRETASPYYRDTLLASPDPRAGLMARMEEGSLRQVERLTKLLIKVQAERRARRRRRREGEE